MAVTEGFTEWIPAGPFPLELLAWDCTASCADIWSSLTHPRTKNVGSCLGVHSVHTIQKWVWKGWRGKKKGENPPTHRQKKKEKNWKAVSRGRGVGGRTLPGVQAGDSQSDQDAFPFKSGWQTWELVFWTSWAWVTLGMHTGDSSPALTRLHPNPRFYSSQHRGSLGEPKERRSQWGQWLIMNKMSMNMLVFSNTTDFAVSTLRGWAWTSEQLKFTWKAIREMTEPISSQQCQMIAL